MSLPYLSNSATTKSLIASSDSHLEEISSKKSELEDKIASHRKTVRQLQKKAKEAIHQPDKLIKIYAVERQVKLKLKQLQSEFDDLLKKEKRLNSRSVVMKEREKLFEDLHIDPEKAIKSLKLEKLKLEYETVESGFVSKKKVGHYIGSDTRVRINYLQSQKKSLDEEILKAQQERDDRLKRKGEEYRPITRKRKG